MSVGIHICGLNGCGKSTVGKALANKIGFHFVDNEDLFFARKDESEPYTESRSRSEAEKLLKKEVSEHENFVFSAVKGDYSNEIITKYKLVALIYVPKEIRIQRIRSRSFEKFGRRILPGGDLYDSEEAFFKMAESRDEEYVEKWIRTLICPVIRIDGTENIEENVDLIIERMKNILI